MQPRLVLHFVYPLELPWHPNLHLSSAEMTGLSKHIWAYYHYQLLCLGVHCLSLFRYATQSLSLSPPLDLILFLPNIHLYLPLCLSLYFFKFVCVTGSCYIVLCGLEVPLQPRLASVLAIICVSRVPELQVYVTIPGLMHFSHSENRMEFDLVNFVELLGRNKLSTVS